jgi:hypothetical protein
VIGSVNQECYSDTNILLMRKPGRVGVLRGSEQRFSARPLILLAAVVASVSSGWSWSRHLPSGVLQGETGAVPGRPG